MLVTSNTYSQRIYNKLTFKYGPDSVFLPNLILSGNCKVSHILCHLVPGEVAGTALYHRLRRRFIYLARLGLVSLTKGKSDLEDGEVPGMFAAATPELLYLIKQVQNSARPTKVQNGEVKRSIYTIPPRCRPERGAACKIMASITPDMYSRDWKDGHPEVKRSLSGVSDYFLDYQADVDNRVILLEAADGSGATLMKPYRTRFTDESRKLTALDNFDMAFNTATEAHTVGVFLTTTTAPRMHKSLWHADRHFGRAWDRYLRTLQKKREDRGGRPQYIQAYEFTKSGLLHGHALLFGLDWLDPIETISRDWKRTGQGVIVHAYKVHKEGGAWRWMKDQPTDSRNRGPRDYLRKYVKKALYSQEAYPLYWAVNKRYFSNSRILTPPHGSPVVSGRWIFRGSWSRYDIPYIILRPRRPMAETTGDPWGGWPGRPPPLVLA